MVLDVHLSNVFSLFDFDDFSDLSDIDITYLLKYLKKKEEKIIVLYMYAIVITSFCTDEELLLYEEELKELEEAHKISKKDSMNNRGLPSEVLWRDLDKIRFGFTRESKYNFNFEKDSFSLKFRQWDFFTRDEFRSLYKFINHFWAIDIKFNTRTWTKSFNSLSAWEKTILSRFINTYIEIDEQNIDWEKPKYIILIDEPDLHLHLDWQRKYIQKLIDVFSTLPEDIHIHFIIATHSPFLISDLPRESLILLKNWKQVDYEWQTFWANYIDLIQNGFFFENKNLMWSFAESIIGCIADNERKSICNGEEYNSKLKQQIWDDFLRDNLLYFKKKKDATD